MTPRRRPRALAASAVLVALACGASACGGGGAEPDADPSSSSTATTPSPTSSGTGTESPTEAVEPYLPVPDDVSLTAPGTDLALGDAAVVAWEPRQDQVGAMTARVEAIEKTSFEESFSGWQLGDDVERSTPYFVRARVVNDGETDLAGLAVPLYAVDDQGGLVEATQFKGTFDPCPAETFPTSFAVGEKADLCLVYLAAPGREITGVGFRPTEAFDQITWTGTITKVGDADDKGADGKDDKGGDARDDQGGDDKNQGRDDAADR